MPFQLKHDPIPKTAEELRKMAAEQRMFGSTADQHAKLTPDHLTSVKRECQQRLNAAVIEELQRVGLPCAPAVYFTLVEELARGAVYTSDNALFARQAGRLLANLLTAEVDAAIEERFGK